MEFKSLFIFIPLHKGIRPDPKMLTERFRYLIRIEMTFISKNLRWISLRRSGFCWQSLDPES